MFDKIILDFDDTIWSRDGLYRDVSKKILDIINHNFSKYIIISGNTYSSIKSKVEAEFDIFNNFNVSVWADCNSVLYKNNKVVGFIDYLNIYESVIKLNACLKKDYITSIIESFPGYSSNLKIKPILDPERDYLVDYLNNDLFKRLDIYDCKAIKAGRTTVDVVSNKNSKSVIFYQLNLCDYNTLYIGDEVDEGNDSSIAKLCSKSINVNSILETYDILLTT